MVDEADTELDDTEVEMAVDILEKYQQRFVYHGIGDSR